MEIDKLCLKSWKTNFFEIIDLNNNTEWSKTPITKNNKIELKLFTYKTVKKIESKIKSKDFM